MFTGIVDGLGKVESVVRGSLGVRGLISAPSQLRDLKIGESISVNGACLTVVSAKQGSFEVDISRETLDKSNLGRLVRGDPVNLERALRVGERLGGHLVYGHVDGLAILRGKKRLGDSTVFELDGDDTIIKYVVYKGSVAVNGVSLTVSGVSGNSFEVTLLPYTLEETNLKYVNPGNTLNIEVDIIGKYVERFLRKDKRDDFLDLLERSGFLEEE